MAKTAWQAYIEGADGLPVASPSVEVRVEATGSLATIYSSAAGAALANPFTAGSDGLARFYADAGVYKITATKDSYTSTFRYVSIGEAAGYDVGTGDDNLPTVAEGRELYGYMLEADDTWTVGTGGDYATLSAALAAASLLRPLYAKNGNILTIQLLSGFTLAEQIMIAGLDLRFVQITSIDASVTINRSAITTAFGAYYPAILCDQGSITILTSLTLDTSGTGTNRVVLQANGQFGAIYVGPGETISGGIFANIYASNGGHIILDDTACTIGGASAAHGAYCAAGKIQAENADASGATTNGFTVINGGIIIATGSTGSTSETINTLTANGIIFK
jgi:hypothetical protein